VLVKVLTAFAAVSLAVTAHAQTTDSLRIYYVGRPVGWERYDVVRRRDTTFFDADFSYIDRGRRVHVASAMALASDYTPRALSAYRFTDTTKTLVAQVEFDGRVAAVNRGERGATVSLSPFAFALSPYTPLSQHLALIRYWSSHGKPDTIDVVPGAPTNRVAVRVSGKDTVVVAKRRHVLTRYTIDGVIWGREHVWTDAANRMAMFAAAGGGLSIKAIRASLLPSAARMMEIASRAAVNDLVRLTASVKPVASGTIAFVGGTLVDGSGAPPIDDAAVVVKNGRIMAAGPASSTTIPKDAKRIDVRGKTIIPGLWDMHAHLHQLEWAPVYLATGVTTVRDMGNELPFAVDLRKAVSSGKARGPNILLAGLIDGGGPNAFGAMSAATPDEGRAIVRRYKSLGFEQVKLYSLLSPAVVAAICEEAHELGMTVTGHVPMSLSLLAAIDSGMDQIAHLAIRGEPGSDSLRNVLEYLKKRGTVIDPTVSWNEIGGHSQAEPLENFQPVTAHLPKTFLEFRAAGWGSATIDTATAHARLARSLAVIREVHRVGIPIVAGTDEGVPGFSVFREMELYVRAGFTPMEALRAATAVSAAAMKLDHDVGTLEVGKRADLLILDANPLDNISNARKVRQVMANGLLFDPGPLFKAAGFIP
jgi:imidazolonepropionase-like amidohydrolase